MKSTDGYSPTASVELQFKGLEIGISFQLLSWSQAL
jgi:hypothetical protein